MEDDYTNGNTQLSSYVSFQQYETLQTIEAYINSKHISGEFDGLDREKPFFNIVTAAVNVWFRATDIDRKNVQIIATKATDWIDSFLATIFLRDWMRREAFGMFLNEWGRALARYGSAVVKFVKSDGSLHISVVPWSQVICDSVDFDANPVIEVIELTPAQLKGRISTHGYDSEAVAALLNATSVRENLDRQRKDNKSGYIKLYEVHGNLPLSLLTGKEEDEDTYAQQMHVVSFVGKRNGRKTEFDDCTVYAGREAKSPYMITHLIKEDGRTLSIGAVEHLFQAQWMVNHSAKAIKDTLDLSSKLLFQTADERFVGRNVLTDIETGDILMHSRGEGMNLEQVNNARPDAVVSWQAYSTSWKGLGNEITGISEAMLGAAPKSGTAWRQTEALLQESYSLFELMTENKGLQIDAMLRERILPFLKTRMNNSDEINAILDQHEIDRIDGIYIKNEAIRRTNKTLVDKVIKGEPISPEIQQSLQAEYAVSIGDSLANLGNRRFFKPSELDSKTWKDQFKDLEWEVEVEVTGESMDVRNMLTTLNTTLSLVVNPGFANNPRAQAIVGRVLELSGAMSPLEYNALPAPVPPQKPNQAPIQAPSTAPPAGGITS